MGPMKSDFGWTNLGWGKTAPEYYDRVMHRCPFSPFDAKAKGFPLPLLDELTVSEAIVIGRKRVVTKVVTKEK